MLCWSVWLDFFKVSGVCFSFDDDWVCAGEVVDVVDVAFYEVEVVESFAEFHVFFFDWGVHPDFVCWVYFCHCMCVGGRGLKGLVFCEGEVVESEYVWVVCVISVGVLFDVVAEVCFDEVLEEAFGVCWWVLECYCDLVWVCVYLLDVLGEFWGFLLEDVFDEWAAVSECCSVGLDVECCCCWYCGCVYTVWVEKGLG